MSIFKKNKPAQIAKSQRDIDIEFAIGLIKMYWTNDETATEGMPGKKINQSWILEREQSLISQCIEIIDSENPLMKNREYLADSVIRCADLQVLVLTKETDISGLTKLTGVSGQLKEHIEKIVKINKELKEHFHSYSEELTFDLLWSDILGRYRMRASAMNIFGAMRVLFNDTNAAKDKDWFRPLFASMCINSESIYRKEIDLPSLFSKNNLIATLQYSTFLNFVMSGDRYPDLTWHEKHPNLESPRF